MTSREHILRDTQATLETTFSAGDAAGAVAYSITDAAGAVVASGAATSQGAGRYTISLAPQSALKLLTIAWTGSWGGATQTIRTYAEVVGGHLFTLDDARTFEDGDLADAAVYSDAKLREVRAGIADLFEDQTKLAFFPRYGREVLNSPSWGGALWLHRRAVRTIRSVKIDGATVSTGLVTSTPTGALYLDQGWYATEPQGIIVEYEHGLDTPPWEIHRAALILARFSLVSSDVSDRTISWSNELGTFRQAIAGSKNPTGIPVVDAALAHYSRRALLV